MKYYTNSLTRIFQKGTLLFSLIFCLLFLSCTAHAEEDPVPARVKTPVATAGESYIKLEWKAVKNVSGYNLYRLNEKDNTLDLIKRMKPTTVKIKLKNLNNNEEYTYCLSAFRTINGITYEGKKSNYVSAVPKVLKPTVPTVSVKKIGNKYVTLQWNSVSNATGYLVYQLNTATNKYQKIGTTTKTSVSIKKLSNGKTYSFKVRAYRKVGGVTRYGNYSASRSAKPYNVSTEIKNMPTMQYRATVTSGYNANLLSDSSKERYLAPGSSVLVTNRGSFYSTVKLSDGTLVSVSNSYLSFNDYVIDSSNDLTKSQAEQFVNYKKYRSSSKYLIWISLYKQRLYIFTGSQYNWTLYKSYKCSSGTVKDFTLGGNYSIVKKQPTFIFDAYSFAYYASFFNGNAIHSWLYWNHNQQIINDGNSYGQPASHGCVRIDISGALYIYKNIPMGSTVIVY